MNTSILGVQWISRAQLIFLRNLFLWNFCRTWAEQYWAFGRKIWGRFSEATCYWASENFFVEWIFEKRSTSETSAAVEISTCSHSTKTFWQCCQSCILFFEKISVKKIILFEKKTLFTKFSGLWVKNRNFVGFFQPRCQNRNRLLQNNFQRKKVFLKEITFFMMTFEF